MVISAEILLLYGSILVVVGLLLSQASYKIGMPTLLLFLAVGMLAGEGFDIEFDKPEMAQGIGVIALTVILFSGGMDTSFKDIKPIIGPGIALATVGVLVTTLLTGSFIYFLFLYMEGGVSLSFPQALLCAAVMSSTDSASVFSILRSKDIQLKHRLKPILELESGSNDPMAYMLTILLIQMIQSGTFDAWSGGVTFLLQFSLGSLLGYLLGRGAVKVLNKAMFHTISLYSILLLGCAAFIFALTDRLGGNGYLAVYIAGLVVGNSKVHHRRSMINFFDGFVWLWQLIMFLSLGLLVNIEALGRVVIPVILIAFFLILFGRPIAVFFTLAPFKNVLNTRGKIYVSWIGLRGAVPIIFATYPWVAGLQYSELFFSIVFSITILSLITQGSTVSWMANKLNLIEAPKGKKRVFKVDLPDEIKSATSEIVVNEGMLTVGRSLRDLPIPDRTLAVMIQRKGKYFVPRGQTELKVDDHVFLISDDEEALIQAYEELGINTYSLQRNS